MIVFGDSGFSLNCTCCGAFLELTVSEVHNPDAAIQKKQSMQAGHVDCPSYPDRASARAALKRKRRDVMALSQMMAMS